MTAVVSATWTSPTGSQCVATGSGGHNLDERAAGRALTLAVEQYCSLGATLAGTAAISHRVVVLSTRSEAATA